MYRYFLKRLFDFLISLIAILVLSPILIILTVIGIFAMKGNPFFTQLRPGKKEKIFRLVKFRTMSNKKDDSGKLLPDSQRLNGYGKFLRATSLDELPSLFNILFGQLAIVGPRPQLVRDMVFMSDEVRKRHRVRPGLTGLAQVNGRNNISWENKFKFDLEYINKISFFGDVKIIFKTIGKVLKRSDVVRDGTVSDLDYGDYLLESGKVTEEEYQAKQLEATELLKKVSK